MRDLHNSWHAASRSAKVEVTNIAHIGQNIGFFDDAGLIACGRQAIVSALHLISPFADKRVSRSCRNRTAYEL